MARSELIELYSSAFKEHGDSPAAVFWPKGRQDERFNALTRHIDRPGDFSILDFGCGLAHLKTYIDARFERVSYTGVDLVPAFIEADRTKFPDASFQLVQSPSEMDSSFDYVVASGAFNILYAEPEARHREIVFEMLQALFDQANVYLSFDMMTDQVDYRQKGAYHQNVVEIYDFVRSSLSKKVVIDQSYLPYEFAVTVWK